MNTTNQAEESASNPTPAKGMKPPKAVNPKAPTVRESVKTLAQATIRSIEELGWDPMVQHLHWHLMAQKCREGSDRLMERIAKSPSVGGQSCLGWEVAPGRTQADVLKVLREVLA